MYILGYVRPQFFLQKAQKNRHLGKTCVHCKEKTATNVVFHVSRETKGENMFPNDKDNKIEEQNQTILLLREQNELLGQRTVALLEEVRQLLREKAKLKEKLQNAQEIILEGLGIK